MNIALARDTLEAVDVAIKQRILIDEDLVKINEIISKRVNKRLEEVDDTE